MVPERILDVNRRYHDAVAGEYDSKWGVSFDDAAQRHVLGKLTKMLGERPGPYPRSLEIGAGTGYFSLNLMRAGVVDEAVCTDVSPGMLETLDANARGLGLDVETIACDAESLPVPDASFDLVVGHAVLHHLPHVERCFAEFARVLRPGGTLFFAGEPSLYGDRIASVPKRVAWRISPVWRRAVGARAASANGHAPADGHELEPEVDVHAFAPRTLAGMLRDAGFANVRIRGEELLANVYGWAVRTLEGTAEPEEVPYRWRELAFRSYLALQRVDAALLEPRLPASLFYNLVLSATRAV
jgi:ubiquinone/menaquinone biosynthesis C-methylase UbiE